VPQRSLGSSSVKVSVRPTGGARALLRRWPSRDRQQRRRTGAADGRGRAELCGPRRYADLHGQGSQTRGLGMGRTPHNHSPSRNARSASRGAQGTLVLDAWHSATRSGVRCSGTEWSHAHEAAASSRPSKRKAFRDHHSCKRDHERRQEGVQPEAGPGRRVDRRGRDRALRSGGGWDHERVRLGC